MTIGKRLRVLIIEDEPVVAMCLEDMLDALGCETAGTAGRLAEGLALAQSLALDAAILDINLGGERSTPIAQVLHGRGVPFVFASGYGAAPESFETRPLIQKPYREQDVDDALRALFG